jgi:membrane protein required for colicin V production
MTIRRKSQMLIDILFIGMMTIAVFKGIRNGLIVAIFSIIGWILGIYAAFRFADVAAGYLKGILEISPKTLYIVSFIIVFLIVMLLVYLGAKMIEKTVELVFMGWVNRIGGIIFYVLLYTLIFSVMIFFAEKFKLISEETITASRVYPWVKPLALIIQRPFLH